MIKKLMTYLRKGKPLQWSKTLRSGGFQVLGDPKWKRGPWNPLDCYMRPLMQRPLKPFIYPFRSPSNFFYIHITHEPNIDTLDKIIYIHKYYTQIFSWSPYAAITKLQFLCLNMHLIDNIFCRTFYSAFFLCERGWRRIKFHLLSLVCKFLPDWARWKRI